ncbi:MAG: hypothetical protein FWD25_00260 [Clostridia bacterium]|nr:hypothetical protein [Clostridia bacterium]
MAKNKKPAVTVRHRTMSIPKDRRWLGVERDRNAELVEFVLPRVYQGVDLAEKTIFVDTMNAQGGLYDTAQPEKHVTEEEIYLSWVVGPLPAFTGGKVKVRLRAIGPDFVWQTETGEFNLATTFLGDDPPNPPGMGYFNLALLQVAELRDQAALSAASAEQSIAAAQIWAESSGSAARGMEVLKQLTTETSDTGPIATIHPVDGLPLDVAARLIAQQAGAGDPSPDNVRPIVGQNALSIVRSGANLSNMTTYNFVKPATRTRNIQTGIMPPGTYTISMQMSGQAGGFSGFGLRAQRSASDEGGDVPGTTTLNFSETSPTRVVGTFVAPNGFAVLYCYIHGDNPDGATVSISDIQLELAPGTNTFEPYAGNAYNITLPQMLYGLPGAEDEVRNDGTVLQNTRLQVLNGSESWTNSANISGSTLARFYCPGGAVGAFANDIPGICDRFAWISPWVLNISGEGCGWVNQASTRFDIVIAKSRIPGWDDAWDAAQRATVFRGWLAANPTTIIAALRAPGALSIPPITIPALPGVNNIWSDGGGAVTAAGRLSPQHAHNQINARLAALENLATMSK